MIPGKESRKVSKTLKSDVKYHKTKSVQRKIFIVFIIKSN